MAVDMPVIWVGLEQEYFCGRDWTDRIGLIPQEKFFSTRNPNEAPGRHHSRMARALTAGKENTRRRLLTEFV
jgi:hypothetical protein